MMTMKEKLQIHREVERADRESRIWYQNNLILDRLTAAFPIGTLVENFGVLAIVDGYRVRTGTQSYTGDLILKDPYSGQRWIGNTDCCMVSA